MLEWWHQSGHTPWRAGPPDHDPGTTQIRLLAASAIWPPSILSNRPNQAGSPRVRTTVAREREGPRRTAPQATPASAQSQCWSGALQVAGAQRLTAPWWKQDKQARAATLAGFSTRNHHLQLECVQQACRGTAGWAYSHQGQQARKTCWAPQGAYPNLHLWDSRAPQVTWEQVAQPPSSSVQSESHKPGFLLDNMDRGQRHLSAGHETHTLP